MDPDPYPCLEPSLTPCPILGPGAVQCEYTLILTALRAKATALVEEEAEVVVTGAGCVGAGRIGA